LIIGQGSGVINCLTLIDRAQSGIVR